MEENKIYLSEKEIPQAWYNILPDLPEPLPPVIHPKTKKPVKPEDLAPIFPMSLIMQEFSPKKWIEIPDEVLNAYKIYRPTPLHRARNLEKALKTKARIYFKNESVSPPGSHKPNTAIPQAYYNKIEGVKRLTTETGAGQWGSALAFACKIFGLECIIFMVKVSYYQKPYRRLLAQSWGATMYPSPSDKTEFGRKILEKEPDSPGSLGIAISEAIEFAIKNEDTKYSLGSVLNHVLLHQTIIGLETKKQFEYFDEYPDIIISCLGGGSNFGGFALPFYYDVLKGNKKIKFIAAQSEVAPNLLGEYKYDFADHAEMTPLLKMYTIGHKKEMEPIKGDGLRYHGAAPILSLLRHKGLLDVKVYPKDEKYVFEMAKIFIHAEGFIPAPESAYSIACAIDEAIRCKESGEKKVIAFNISGHGFLDLDGYSEVLGI